MLEPKVIRTLIEAGDKKIPAKIYQEVRGNIRFSIVRKGAILRMPLMLPQKEQQKQIAAFEAWVRNQLEGQQNLQERFTMRNYRTGDVLKVGSKEYRIALELTKNKSSSARLQGDLITLRINDQHDEVYRHKVMKHLLSRIVAKDFFPGIYLRVAELNKLHFQRAFRSVNLKYNLTNWGSCSSKGNINLSTRVLFAPADVIDYVIIHELAHLVEMNHSAKFWELVEKAVPDYKQKEAWLKENWQSCDF